MTRQPTVRLSAGTGCLLALAVCPLSAAGCAKSPPAAAVAAAPGEKQPLPVFKLPQPPEGHPTRTLTQELGLVRPGRTISRRFTLANDSREKWTLAELHSDCNCTASRPLADAVPPGGAMEVEVDYTPLSVAMDDRHRVGVQFKEPSAPWVWLEVRASIRDPITLAPPEVTVRATDRGRHESSFGVQNYTDRDVRLLAVRASAPWLTASASDAARATAPPRQTWRVALRIDSSGLPAKLHRAEVEVRTDCPESPTQVVPVEFDLRPPVQAGPDRLAFGTVEPGVAARRKVMLRYAAASPASVAVTHTVGPQLSVTYTPLSATNGELSAVLTPAAAGGTMVGGVVLVNFGGEDLPPLEIPVSATVRRP